MRKHSSRVKDQYQAHSSKSIKRKQFLVDPNRVQLDEYMLKQIKRNKKSVKCLSKEVTALKKQVVHLRDQHDDYMMLEKTRAQEYSQSHLAFLHNKNHNRITLTQQSSKCHHKSKDRFSSKDSSLLSLSSSAKTSRRSSSKSKSKTKGSEINSSKQRLGRKIEQLKAKALLQQKDKEKIKREVKQKIMKVMSRPMTENMAPDVYKRNEQEEDEYAKLLSLLKTNNEGQSPQNDGKKMQHETSNQVCSPEQRKLQNHSMQNEERQVPEYISHSTHNIKLKSTTDIETNFQKESRQNEGNTNFELRSETNLLESSPSRTPQQQSPKQTKKGLSFSRCIEMRVQSQRVPSSCTENSGIEGIFGPPLDVKSGTVEMSFEGSDSTKKRLRQLEFQFDQLVRQQLMTVDPREKQMLSQTIRSVLWSINQLKGKISKDSGSV